jgi:hypothetical protein
MSILAIDVGVNTGYAVLNDKGEAVMTGKVHVKDLETSVLAMWATSPAEKTAITHVCIEYPVFNVMSTTANLRHADEVVRRMYPDAHVVRPGVWKSSAVALQPMTEYEHLSKHEQDAINIARWYKQRLDKKSNVRGY